MLCITIQQLHFIVKIDSYALNEYIRRIDILKLNKVFDAFTS